MWNKYTRPSSVRNLRYEGRELLGKTLHITVKRDGENVSPWLNVEGEVIVGSRNHPVAASDIQHRMKLTPEWGKIQDMLKSEFEEYGSRLLPYGELLKPVSPTRIEPRRKHIHWIMFDIWDMDNERWIGYNRMYQYGQKYGIPVVELIEIAKCNTMEELQVMIDENLKWARKHHREGFVIKCKNAYGKELHDIHPWVRVKCKIDLPKKVKLRKSKENQSHYPPMPDEKILSAIRQAYDTLEDKDEWRNVSIAMPLVARYISTEAREHNYNVPRNMFYIYENTSVEDLEGKVEMINCVECNVSFNNFSTDICPECGYIVEDLQ